MKQSNKLKLYLTVIIITIIVILFMRPMRINANFFDTETYTIHKTTIDFIDGVPTMNVEQYYFEKGSMEYKHITDALQQIAYHRGYETITSEVTKEFELNETSSIRIYNDQLSSIEVTNINQIRINNVVYFGDYFGNKYTKETHNKIDQQLKTPQSE